MTKYRVMKIIIFQLIISRYLRVACYILFVLFVLNFNYNITETEPICLQILTDWQKAPALAFR